MRSTSRAQPGSGPFSSHRPRTDAFSSPRPMPNFFLESQTFSTKKERGTPHNAPPPRPPVKSAPPVSRIFPHRPVQRAQVVSFKTSDKSFLGTRYNENSRDLYFNQCFEVISKLGAGSYGEVFKVRSREDGKYYAVKRSQERFRGESDRRRKLEEVAKHEKLPPHNNCVHFFKAWEERQRLYIQIELCQACLADFADNNHDIAELVLWNYLVDLLMAVKHLHDHNLIHMDVKLDNIFVSKNGICKLGDFGLVLDLSKSPDMSEAQEGDPRYLAPELMEGSFSKSADIFSLGMAMLELASDLDLPRGSEGWHHLRTGRLPVQFMRNRSFDLKYVIRQMLDPDPSTRPTVDQLLAFPCIRRVWKKRCREYMMKSAVTAARNFMMSILDFLIMISLIVISPLHRLRHTSTSHSDNYCTSSDISSRSGLSQYSHTSSPVFDSSISDDDCFEDDIVANNSVGVPLDSSSSSEEAFQFSRPPPRMAFTTPAVRTRSAIIPSPLSSSPVLLSKYTQPSSMSSFDESFDDERPGTPNLIFNVDGDDTALKPNIEPKNLLEMFEAASDEEDDD